VCSRWVADYGRQTAGLCRSPPSREPAKKFYGSGQGFCEARRIEFGFVGVHRLSGAGDAPSQADKSREHSRMTASSPKQTELKKMVESIESTFD